MHGRDRLRELLDAVLAGADEGGSRTLAAMAGDAHASPYHFTRRLTRDAGEPPVAMRRRVLLERAAWQLRSGSSVTDAAFAAGYGSVEGFSRAFTRAYGEAPGTVAAGDPRSHWLPAPNGIHFHPPTSLWVHTEEAPMDPLTEQLLHHDLDDTRVLLDLGTALPDELWRRPVWPGTVVQPWDGEEASLAAVLGNHVRAKEVWLSAIAGLDVPHGHHDPAGGVAHDSAAALLERHDATAPRWLATVRDIDRRGAWGDLLVDALCDPPESFVLGSVVAHVLTYAAHRRQLARHLLRAADIEVDTGDPISWLRARTGGTP